MKTRGNEGMGIVGGRRYTRCKVCGCVSRQGVRIGRCSVEESRQGVAKAWRLGEGCSGGKRKAVIEKFPSFSLRQ